MAAFYWLTEFTAHWLYRLQSATAGFTGNNCPVSSRHAAVVAMLTTRASKGGRNKEDASPSAAMATLLQSALFADRRTSTAQPPPFWLAPTPAAVTIRFRRRRHRPCEAVITMCTLSFQTKKPKKRLV
ncbi:hypothetical protein E4U09_003650 [Claviceps aff. purpurea]|uniref:Uncharacterized protein n=1 Tax=Claviceps aff. purpurea TaxID=1967640 RepID=A0A9P7U1W9_9HYPO|nr:hypothetical protein E4U09_003650 [Claviceps aff. purpurea]